MPPSTHHPWLHRLAIATAAIAMFPIVVGALVTTLGAGMAFLDWPTSDGQNMLLYNIFEDLRHGRTDKVVEHGHRLGGMVIGLMSILLAGMAWTERRTWVRMLGLSILVGVILQGILGGARVLADERLLAMLHGALAAVVFSMMAAFAQVTSPGWQAAAARPPAKRDLRPLRSWALLSPVAILLQYGLGGLLRHLGMALHEHMGMAVLVLLLAIATAVRGLRSGDAWIQRSALALFSVVWIQFGLGLWTFVTKFGFPWTGYVAVAHSPLQILLRTSHTVVGMLLLVSSLVLLFRVLRVIWLHPETAASRSATSMTLAGPLRAEGRAG